jgi:hypothetical protein
MSTSLKFKLVGLFTTIAMITLPIAQAEASDRSLGHSSKDRTTGSVEKRKRGALLAGRTAEPEITSTNSSPPTIWAGGDALLDRDSPSTGLAKESVAITPAR